MPYIETTYEVAESIADMCGIYSINGCECGCYADDESGGDHTDECVCRSCFVSDLKQRIRQAVVNDERLNKAGIRE